MNVHLTGDRGFIAGHLRDELWRRGHNVSGSDRECAFSPETTPDGTDAIVLAGALVGRRWVDPQIIDYNVRSVLAWARFARHVGLPVLYLSTSEVYGPRVDERPVAEWAVLARPHNLYGLTKLWGEQVLELELDPRHLTVARLSMPYGPGHPPGVGRAALTNFLEAGRTGRVITVHRGARRSWCWVGDTVAALSLLLERGEHGTWNVGRDDNETTMLEVAELAGRLTTSEARGFQPSPISEIDPPAGYTLVKRLDCSKIRGLGWQPTVELDEGMRRTLAWLETLGPAGP